MIAGLGLASGAPVRVRGFALVRTMHVVAAVGIWLRLSVDVADLLYGELDAPGTHAPPGVRAGMRVGDELGSFPRGVEMRTAATRLVREAYPTWAAAHPDAPCPPLLEELAAAIGMPRPLDAWGSPLLVWCSALGSLVIDSAGVDGTPRTSDDVRLDSRALITLERLGRTTP